jgi:hypothetical protein
LAFKIKKEFDILVGGGGLAGVCAAIAAIRQLNSLKKVNPRVALINDRPVLGGVSSSEIRVPPIGAGRNPWGFETGIISELLYEERARNHNRWEMGTANSLWDIILWEAVKKETGIELYLNTSIRSVLSKKNNENITIEKIFAAQLGNETDYEFSATQFIDCTGDSTIAFEAGASMIIGRESKEKYGESLANDIGDDACMGSSLLFQAKDIGRPCPFKAPEYAAKYHSENSLFFRPHQNFRNGYYWIEVGYPYKTIEQNEEIRDELIRHVMGVWDHLKNHCTLFGKQVENWALDWVGMIPGKRGSRRIEGDTVIIENDLRTARLFQDRVGFGGHFFDLHTIGGILAADKPGNPVDTNPDLWDQCRLKPYPIPLSSLYSKNVSNLMMAGRNISTSHVANGSTRVMLTNALLGQAVGTASAYCVSKKLPSRECAKQFIEEIQQSLLRQSCFLHGIKNKDKNDLALSASVEASSESSLELNPLESEAKDPSVFRHKMDLALGTVIPVSSNTINSIGLWLISEDAKSIPVNISIFSLENIWDIQNTQKLVCTAKAIVSAGSKGPVQFEINQKVKSNQFYFITVEPVKGELYWQFRRDHPTGVFSVWRSATSGFWKYYRHERVEGFETFCLNISPEQKPFAANQILSGETRPYCFTNIWVSDPKQLNHAWLKLKWKNLIEFNQIEITFDTDLSFTNETMPEFTISKKCVKDYEISCFANGEWRTLIKVEGNYHRQNIHQFSKIFASEIEIIVLLTNGDASSRIYEVRVY